MPHTLCGNLAATTRSKLNQESNDRSIVWIKQETHFHPRGYLIMGHMARSESRECLRSGELMNSSVLRSVVLQKWTKNRPI